MKSKVNGVTTDPMVNSVKDSGIAAFKMASFFKKNKTKPKGLLSKDAEMN